MSASLEKLADNLIEKDDPADKYKQIHNMKREFPDHLDLLSKKGLYMYEWMDNLEKRQEPTLPPNELFYNQLKQQSII